MQLFFRLIVLLPILFVRISNGNDIRCTSPFYCPKATVPFSNPLALPVECQENNNFSDTSIRASACGIDYRINYDYQVVYIDFLVNSSTGTSEEHNQVESLVQSVWLGFNRYTDQPSITQRQYFCNTQDDCALSFYKSNIERLIGEGKSILDKIQRLLYNESLPMVKARRRCINYFATDNRTSAKCPDGFCYASEAKNEYDNKHTIEEQQRCEHASSPSFFSLIERRSPSSPTFARRSLDYRCNKNVCNRDGLIKIVQSLIDDYTQWNEPKSLLIETQSEPNQTLTKTPSAPKSSGFLRTVSFKLLFILMFITQLF